MALLGRETSPVKVALLFSFVGSMLAAMVPACLNALQVTRTAEAMDNLARLTRAVAQRRANVALQSTPLTPAQVPRGVPTVDAAETWSHPTWKALGFALDEPHWYAYRIEIPTDLPNVDARVLAFGDLDGDGVQSTFERRVLRSGGTLVIDPAVLVTSDLE